jgi:predicted O-methyltransferase YrrM
MTSLEASKLFENGSLDFVFIDGDHSYQGCSTDIDCWFPKLKSGGLLSGHDYRDDKDYGVKRAVHEFLGDRELRLGLNFTWFITK